jgi:hypothetical protein
MGQTGASGMSCEDLVEEGLQDRAKLRRHRHDAHRVAFVGGGPRRRAVLLLGLAGRARQRECLSQ